MAWLASDDSRWRAQPYRRAPEVSLAETKPSTDWRYNRWVAERLVEIVLVEGPMYVEDAIRRAFDAWGVPRVGARMREAVMLELDNGIPLERRPRLRSDVLWPPELHARSWSTFRVAEEAGAARPAESIPPEEIRNAALAVLSRALSIDKAQLVGQLMQIFGISRRGSKVVEHFESGIALAVAAGHATLEGQTVRFLDDAVSAS